VPSLLREEGIPSGERTGRRSPFLKELGSVKKAPERISYTIDQFMAATGFSRRKTYEAINSGELRSMKFGKRRMITDAAAREYLAVLEARTAEARKAKKRHAETRAV